MLMLMLIANAIYNLLYILLAPGSSVQHFPDCRLLLDPACHPVHPLQFHLSGSLGAHKKIKGWQGLMFCL